MSLPNRCLAVVWKVFWSSNGYRGWDHVMYRAWSYGQRSRFGYVAYTAQVHDLRVLLHQ